MASILGRAFKLDPVDVNDSTNARDPAGTSDPAHTRTPLGVSDPTYTPPGFTDLESNIHTGYINALHATGAVRGCTIEPPRYCPREPITRGQAASILNSVRNIGS